MGGAQERELRRDGRFPNVPPVKLSVKSDYAARAVLGLASRFHDKKAVRVEDLAKQHGLPPSYLVQILIELKSNQIVRSVRGKEGGYLLARSPAEITLGDVLAAIHGNIFEPPAVSDSKCPAELRDAWRTLQQSVERTAVGINFQQLLDNAAKRSEMYYI